MVGTVFAFAWSLATQAYAFQTLNQTISDLRLLYVPVCFVTFYYAQVLWNRRNEKEIWFAFKAFLIYEMFNCIVLLLIYPGAWQWDDIGVYNMLAMYGQLFYWQHYLTAVLHAFALFLIPCPAGVIFVQATIIALIFGYCAYVLKRISIWNGSRWKYALLAPFFFFPTIVFNMFAMRLSLYCMLEILLVVVILEPKLTDHDDIWKRHNRCLFLVVLTAVLANWRSEGILYFLMVPVLMFILYPGKRRVMVCGIMLLGCVFSTLAVNLPQKAGIGSSNDYDLTGIIAPLQPLVCRAYEEQETDMLSIVDRVVDVDVLVQGNQEGKDGITLYWDANAHLVRDGYTESDYQNLMRAYLKMVLRYPEEFLTERIKMFLTTGKSPGRGSIGALYSSDLESVSTFTHNYLFNRPINNELRVKVGDILLGEGAWAKWTGRMFNFLAQAAALLIFTVWLLIKRSKYTFIALVMEVRIPLTFLTAPANLFMYYYNLWLFGSFVICGTIGFLLYKYGAGFRQNKVKIDA